MALLLENCPRCGSERITFDLLAGTPVGRGANDWQFRWEVFAVCRHSECGRGTIFAVERSDYNGPNDPMQIGGTINDKFRVRGYVNIKNLATTAPPDHLPEDVARAFNEAATSVAVECWNAAGAMFRACVDLTTRPMLPPLPEGEVPPIPPWKVRRDLGLRLAWLFDNNHLPESLRDLSQCIREDGNDAAHQVSLRKEDAEDMEDFVIALLTRIFTEPAQLRLAEERRKKRRGA